jgi:ADP-ribose pyrophosphatase YjhB (NUDIX family)
LEDAAAREVREETGLTAVGLRQIDVAEIIDRRPNGTLHSHYVLVVFAGAAAIGEVRAGDDAAEVRWVELAEALRLPLTADTARLLTGGAALTSR